MLDDVRGVEEGAVDYGTRGRYDPPKLWLPCSPSCSCCCVRARGGTEVDTSAWRLSEAKTQRRPTARERESEKVGFLCCFVVFVSFFRAGQEDT